MDSEAAARVSQDHARPTSKNTGAEPNPSRLTRNDRVILSCLQSQTKPIKAYEILERLRGEGVNAPMTVYRALGRLAALGLVKKIESMNAFCATPEEGQGGSLAFLICETCGATGSRLVEPSVLPVLAGGAEAKEVSIELKTSCFAQSRDLVSGNCRSNG